MMSGVHSCETPFITICRLRFNGDGIFDASRQLPFKFDDFMETRNGIITKDLFYNNSGPVKKLKE